MAIKKKPFDFGFFTGIYYLKKGEIMKINLSNKKGVTVSKACIANIINNENLRAFKSQELSIDDYFERNRLMILKAKS